MTRVPFWTAERPLKEYPGAKHEMPPADQDFAFVPGCQNSGRKEEELVCSTWASSFLRTIRFHPGTKTHQNRPPKAQKKMYPGTEFSVTTWRLLVPTAGAKFGKKYPGSRPVRSIDVTRPTSHSLPTSRSTHTANLLQKNELQKK